MPEITPKQKILEMLGRLPDDIDYDRAVESIYVLKKIEIGLAQYREGKGIPDEELWSELLGDDEEEVPTRVDAASQG